MPLSIDQRKQRWAELLNGGSTHMVYIISEVDRA